MPGFVPGIHESLAKNKFVYGRAKPGHDGIDFYFHPSKTWACFA
jgi:hypothetical protein